MSDNTWREMRRATLRERYRGELEFLASHDTSPEVAFTGGTCTAIETVVIGRRLLATNGDHCVIGPDEDQDYQDVPAQWYVGVFDIDDEEGDRQVAEGTGPDLRSAYTAALASLQRGDHVQL